MNISSSHVRERFSLALMLFNERKSLMFPHLLNSCLCLYSRFYFSVYLILHLFNLSHHTQCDEKVTMYDYILFLVVSTVLLNHWSFLFIRACCLHASKYNPIIASYLIILNHVHSCYHLIFLVKVIRKICDLLQL